MSTPSHLDSPSRRQFIMQGLTAAGGVLLGGRGFAADPFANAPTAHSETLATTLYKSLNDAQRTALCFPWENELREKVDNNWHITKQPINQVLDKDQQAMVREIFDKLHSDEYKAKVWEQFDQDNAAKDGKGGFGSASIALFGEPGSGKFSFAFTGRHCTRRCDGDFDKGAVFGGPIFYGHAAKSFNEEADHAGNVYWYQAKRANEVFAALDGKQREKALRPEARGEAGNGTVKLTGLKTGLEGIPMADLSSDQKDLVRKVLADLLLPFRKADSEEAMRHIEKNGFDNLHMAFFQKGDIGNDKIWDNWIIEGPSMVWYFRGAPHVHCWAHIRDTAKA
jgi:hypothetical protein